VTKPFDSAREREFFDSFEQRHGEYDVLAESSYRRILTVFEREMNLFRDRTCVDLGCGTGAFTRRLTAFGLRATGIDISERSIQRATALGGGTFLVGDICGSALEDRQFDYVMMSGVLHHLPSRAERSRALREAWRLLKPGGRFYSYDPNGHSPSMWLYRHPDSPLYSAEGKTENEILLTRAQLALELQAAAFTGVRVRGLSGIAYRYVEGRLARRLLPVYNWIYEPAIRWSGFERRLGTFLIATGVKGE
jgi:SAM-dependent methyltransferase